MSKACLICTQHGIPHDISWRPQFLAVILMIWSASVRKILVLAQAETTLRAPFELQQIYLAGLELKRLWLKSIKQNHFKILLMLLLELLANSNWLTVTVMPYAMVEPAVRASSGVQYNTCSWLETWDQNPIVEIVKQTEFKSCVNRK